MRSASVTAEAKKAIVISENLIPTAAVAFTAV
jgi:hypothetical protein